MKRLMSALVLGTALTGGTVACGSVESPPPTEETVQRGTLSLESVEWVKDTSSSPEVVEFEGIEGEKHQIRSLYGEESLEILAVTDTDITVSISGAYFTGDGMEDNPEFTLTDGASVNFNTASADAGVEYKLTYRK